MDCLMELDLHVNGTVKSPQGRLPVGELLQTVNAPYLRFVWFYLEKRDKAILEMDPARKIERLNECLIRSSEYFLTVTKCYEQAVYRNDELSFKAILLFLNCITCI